MQLLVFVGYHVLYSKLFEGLSSIIQVYLKLIGMQTIELFLGINAYILRVITEQYQ